MTTVVDWPCWADEGTTETRPGVDPVIAKALGRPAISPPVDTVTLAVPTGAEAGTITWATATVVVDTVTAPTVTPGMLTWVASWRKCVPAPVSVIAPLQPCGSVFGSTTVRLAPFGPT